MANNKLDHEDTLWDTRETNKVSKQENKITSHIFRRSSRVLKLKLILLQLSAQAEITEVRASPSFEGHRLLNISWRRRKQREDATAGRPWCWAEREDGRMGGGGVGRGGREGGRRILSERFYFYSSTSLTVTPSPPLHYPSIPHSQSLFVSKATASHVSLTTYHPISFPTNTPKPSTPLNRQCSDYHGVAATQGVWAGEGKT